MKKAVAVLAIVAAAAVVAVAQPTDSGKRPDKPGAAPAAAPAPAPKVDEALVAREKTLWDGVKAKDVHGLGKMCAGDFLFVTPEGMHDKAWMLFGIQKDTLVECQMSDARTFQLSPEASTVVYKAVQEWRDVQQKTQRATTYCQTTWVRQGAKWTAQTHQETWLPPGGK